MIQMDIITVIGQMVRKLAIQIGTEITVLLIAKSKMILVVITFVTKLTVYESAMHTGLEVNVKCTAKSKTIRLDTFHVTIQLA